ncbi:hypothetical protein CDAR_467701 [Caerostris darwini]|uniref:CCHC-type domain-containing protein n=1 Tax=Caerostris darwini TaxID=1538125 RepID=A0AAV4SPF3_9ARAC|nr:hypothetical protein CDAR_467701 [Caerostris darwini]
MNEHLAFLRKRLYYAENDLKSVIASFDVGLRTVTDVTNAQKMTDDARTELELYQKGECPIKERLENPTCINCQQTGHLARRGCPKFPKPRQQPNRDASRTVSHSTKPFQSKKITEGISFASMVKGVPPQQFSSTAITAGNQHDSSAPNINSNDKDSFGKVLYIINEFISIFNSLGGIENVYNSLKNCTSDFQKMQIVLRCFENIGSSNN